MFVKHWKGKEDVDKLKYISSHFSSTEYSQQISCQKCWAAIQSPVNPSKLSEIYPLVNPRKGTKMGKEWEASFPYMDGMFVDQYTKINK